MKREFHVRFCERLWGKFPGSTHQILLTNLSIDTIRMLSIYRKIAHMKLTAKHLGLITALLFGVTHADAPAEGSALGVLGIASSATPTGEAITANPENQSTSSTLTAEVITANPEDQSTSHSQVFEEGPKQLTSSEKLTESLSEVNKALKEGVQTMADVACTVVDVIGSGLFIGKKVVILAVSIGMVGWFTAKALYITGSIIAEFYQTTFASQ